MKGKRKCANCGKMYDYSVKRLNRSRPTSTRGKNTVNCSKKCSHEWYYTGRHKDGK
jgi:hypothetical protein